MPIKFRKKKKGASIVMQKRVGIEEAASLLSHFKEGIDSPITIDMRKVESIDTSTVQLILAAKDAAKKRGTPLQILCPPLLVTRILNRVGLDSEICIN